MTEASTEIPTVNQRITLDKPACIVQHFETKSGRPFEILEVSLPSSEVVSVQVNGSGTNSQIDTPDALCGVYDVLNSRSQRTNLKRFKTTSRYTDPLEVRLKQNLLKQLEETLGITIENISGQWIGVATADQKQVFIGAVPDGKALEWFVLGKKDNTLKLFYVRDYEGGRTTDQHREVAFVVDTQGNFFPRYAEQFPKKFDTAKESNIVYCTWHRYGTKIDPDSLIKELPELAKARVDMVMLDDGWQYLSTQEMERIRDNIRRYNMRIGLWYDPFRISEAQSHTIPAAYLIKDHNGKPLHVSTPQFPHILSQGNLVERLKEAYKTSQFYGIDISNPEARAWIIQKILTFPSAEMLKLDFLTVAQTCSPHFSDKSRTSLEYTALFFKELKSAFAQSNKPFPEVMGCTAPLGIMVYPEVTSLRVAHDAAFPPFPDRLITWADRCLRISLLRNISVALLSRTLQDDRLQSRTIKTITDLLAYASVRMKENADKTALFMNPFYTAATKTISCAIELEPGNPEILQNLRFLFNGIADFFISEPSSLQMTQATAA